MICYKDKTFCTDAPQCKNARHCYRNLTKEEEERSLQLGLPVAICSFKLTCRGWKEKNNE